MRVGPLMFGMLKVGGNMQYRGNFNRLGLTVFAAVIALLVTGPAWAEWRYDGGEGSYYAYTTDGGFVDTSYQNGLMFFCPDDGTRCKFSVKINGQLSEPRVIVSFAFGDGTVVQRMAEELDGGPTEIGWEGNLLENLQSQSTVTVSVGNGHGHTFSLSGSTDAIRRAMNP